MTDKQKQQMMIRLSRIPEIKMWEGEIFIKWEYKYFNTVNLILWE